MPRTIWKPDPRWKDDPQWNNPSHLRGCAEEWHYERIRRTWSIPLYIHPASPTDGVRCLSFRDIFCRNTGRRLHQLTPDDCRIFCWKDCAIYGNLDIARYDTHKLLDFVYRQWFPQRAQDKDVSDRSFFAKLMCFDDPADWNLQEILRFHEVLCKKLCELEKEIPDTMPINPFQARGWEAEPKVAEYKLRDTFPVVFIVVEPGWQERGVLLVWKSKDDASRHNCEEGGEVTAYDGNDSGDLGQACVFRCPLKRAMQFVVSTDPERAKQRREYNELLEETLGEVEDDHDVTAPGPSARSQEC
jgi:hypothetical protein